MPDSKLSTTEQIDPTTWVSAFLRYGDYSADTMTLVDLTMEGLHRITTQPEMIEILSGDRPKADYEQKLRRAKERADDARREIDRDYSILHAHALMGLWSALEASIEDALTWWIQNVPDARSSAEVGRIKVPLAAFSEMAADEQARYIVIELARELKADLKSGASRFESLLKLVNLDGPVDRRVRDAIYEAQQLRNALAHRGGTVDRRLADACPQLALTTGSPILISHDQFHRYYFALSLYVVIVRNRFAVALGHKATSIELPGFEGVFSQERSSAPAMPDGPARSPVEHDPHDDGNSPTSITSPGH